MIILYWFSSYYCSAVQFNFVLSIEFIFVISIYVIYFLFYIMLLLLLPISYVRPPFLMFCSDFVFIVIASSLAKIIM